MTGVEERLLQVLSFFSVPDGGGYAYIPADKADMEDFVSELSARGLVVVDVQTIRDLLHLLDTANGYWVTDRPQFVLIQAGLMMEAEGIPDDLENHFMAAQPKTYWRQSFTDTEAVKRAREMIGQQDADR